MTYTLTDNGEVVLQMSQDDYLRLIHFLGIAAGHLHDSDNGGNSFWQAMAFANEINRTNPAWIPYEIPAKP